MARRFKYLGKDVIVNCPLRLDGIENMSISSNVVINYRCWLAAVSVDNNGPLLEIGEGTIIGNYNHIYATKKISIGNYVLIADKVYISDNLHSYEDVNLPVMSQKIVQRGVVEITNGAWIGENVCILGSKVGRNSVIGANSVVTRDIPDFCVAAGVPARVIKKYCLESSRWVAVD